MNKCQGQSIVEFLVAATFALVPLLFLTTYLGKVGDMQHRAVEAARYSTWEAAKTSKGAIQIQNEINKRVLYKDYRSLDSSADGQANNLNVASVDPLYFHSGDSGNYETLIAENNNSFNTTTTANDSPDSSLYGARVSVARSGPARISVSQDGMITGSVEYVTSSTKWLQNVALSQRAHNTMLSETWRAPRHDQVEDVLDRSILARSSFINNGLTDLAIQLAALAGLKEWEELDLGHVEHDVVPCSRLVGGGNSEDACR